MTAPLYFLRRQTRSKIRAGNDQSTHQLRVIPRQDQRKVTTVTVSHDVDCTKAELLDYCRGVIRHHLVGERPGAIRSVTVPPLIDADDRTIGREIVSLLCEAVVEEDRPPVQKNDRGTVAVRLYIQLSAPHLV